MLADLYAYLITASTVGLTANQAAAIADLRSVVGTRMYPDVLAEGSDLPSLTYQLVSNHTDHTIDGANDALFYSRVQIDVWTLEDAVMRDRLSSDVKAALDGFIGSMNGNTPVDVSIWDNEVNTYEPDRKQYRATLDFRVLHH